MAPSSACSASKLCGGSRRRLSSAPGRRVTFDGSFSGSMAELLKDARGCVHHRKSAVWTGIAESRGQVPPRIEAACTLATERFQSTDAVFEGQKRNRNDP